MQGILGLVLLGMIIGNFAVGKVASKNSRMPAYYIGYRPFDQCVEGLQSTIDYCENTFKPDPTYSNYRRVPIEAWTQPILQSDGSYYLYLQGGCMADQSGIPDQLNHTFFCDTLIPSTVKIPENDIPVGKNACDEGSIVRTDEMSLGESVQITGTKFNLVYTSERTIGYRRAYRSSAGLPSFFTGSKSNSKTSYAMPIQVGYHYYFEDGRVEHLWLYQGQTGSFIWDGKNISGNLVEGPISFQLGNEVIGNFYALSFDHTTATSVGTWNVKLMGLGGWNVDIHHRYDRVGKKLYLGDGSVTYAKADSVGSNYRVLSDDGSKIYYFDSTGRHLTTNNSMTNSVLYTFNYAANGYLTSIVDAYGNTTSVQRDGSGNLEGIQSPYGQVTQLSIGGDGYLASITNPKNETYSMSYFVGGLLHTFQKPKGQVSTMSYDLNGNLVGDSNSAGNFINLIPIAGGLEIRDALGLKRTSMIGAELMASSRTDSVRTGENISYYSKKNVIETLSQGPNSSQKDFSPNPRFPDSHSLPSNYLENVWALGLNYSESFTNTVTNTSATPTPFNYDSIQYQTTTNSKISNATYTRSTGVTNISSPVGRTSSITTDTLGKITNAKFANFQPVQYSYDSHGRLRYITQSTRQTEIQYNASGDISGVKNALNQTTGFSYDLAGRVQSVILPDLRTISYAYDANGNIASITPAGSSAHAFTFNPFDLASVYTPPMVPTSTPATQYTYDNAKRITQITKSDSSTMVFNYDPTTQLLTSIVSSGDTTTMTIDPYSNQPSATTSQDGIATTQTYASSLFVSSATTNASSVNIGGVAYTYNNDFLPTNLTITSASGSSSVNYTYDNDNIMKTAGSLVISLDGTTGIPTKTTLNKIQEIYSFDSSYGEPVSIQAKYVNGATTTPLFSQSYTRDALGRISTKTETVGTTTNQFAYTYDTAGRLTNVTKNATAYSNYTFSSNNNATSGNASGTSFTATYDAQDRILTYNTNTYTHTLNGEMKSKTVGGVTTNYTYNGFGMLKTAKVGSGAVVTYLYDGLNRRIGRKSGSTVQKYWVYQDQLRIGAELNSSGAITKKFIYGTKVNVPDYMIIGSTTYKIVSDHLGSVRLVVNAATGAISQTMEYNERGEVLVDTSPGFQPFGFAGGVYESDLKLVHFGARTYDPVIGRWLSKDPIDFEGGDTNLYGYVMNDPINLIDPNGQFAVPLFIGLAYFLYGSLTDTAGQGQFEKERVADVAGFFFGNGVQGATVKNIGRNTPNQSAVIDLAKQYQRKGLSSQDAATLVQWAKEYNIPGNPRIDGAHIGTNTNFPHAHIGPVNHIPICK